ncbi:hypothetical protein [Acinetobacter shaoyimingii]|uniref:Uncharacterized protein n=1 Tax=Acinetobacter shaoyimingii TaxID=2715164 RepID=A0A6G8RSA0_9GAMM|nr:hypothetical protein [Acinetobacter shaoyimingii]QIO04784.1 hypothetical protein G8E00_01800 [Acinetobacter shaoyimingii]
MTKNSIIPSLGLLILTALFTVAHAQPQVTHQSSKEPYYFVSFLPNEPARFLGGCSKASQTINTRTAYRGIDEPVLKRAIRNKVRRREEFTAMDFVIDGKRRHAIILDQAFIKKRCHDIDDENLKIVVDVYQIDIQNDQDFSQVWVISKVYQDQP